MIKSVTARQRRKELEGFYSDPEKQQLFFRYLESPKTTCPARNFLMWLDIQAWSLQRRLARSGGVQMSPVDDYHVCKAIYDKYIAQSSPFPIYMPNLTKLDISSIMEEFKTDVESGTCGDKLSALGDHVFDEAQNAVEVSLYRALKDFETDLEREEESKSVSAVISTDSDGGSIFITGSFADLMRWFFLDCGDDKFVGEFSRFLCIYRMFDSPATLFKTISESLRNPGIYTTNAFDKDLIVARTKMALRLWVSLAYSCDIEPTPDLLSAVLELVASVEQEQDDRTIGPFVRRFVEHPLVFPSALPSKQSVDLQRWGAIQVAQQLTLVDAFEYYSTTPDELFAIGEASGAPHITTLSKRVDVVGGWVAASILQSSKPWQTLSTFVGVLEQLFHLNNYNGIKAVLIGVDHPGVARLKKVGKQLTAAEREFLGEIKQLIDTTELYRKHVEGLGDISCIPYIGTHVRLMSEAYGKNVAKIKTDKGIGYTAARGVSDVMYNYLRFQRFPYFAPPHSLVLAEELYAQLVHIPVFSDEKLSQLSASIQPLDRKEKKGLTPVASLVSPRASPMSSPLGSALSGFFSPRKNAAKNNASASGGNLFASPRARGNSLGDNESE